MVCEQARPILKAYIKWVRNCKHAPSVKEEAEGDAPCDSDGLDYKSPGSVCSRDKKGISIYCQVLQLTSYVRST